MEILDHSNGVYAGQRFALVQEPAVSLSDHENLILASHSMSHPPPQAHRPRIPDPSHCRGHLPLEILNGGGADAAVRGFPHTSPSPGQPVLRGVLTGPAPYPQRHGCHFGVAPATPKWHRRRYRAPGSATSGITRTNVATGTGTGGATSILEIISSRRFRSVLVFGDRLAGAGVKAGAQGVPDVQCPGDSAVDPGYVVDPVHGSPLNQPHSPDPPHKARLAAPPAGGRYAAGGRRDGWAAGRREIGAR